MFKKNKEKQRKLYSGKLEEVMYAEKKRKEEEHRAKAHLEHDIVRSKARIVW